jgi:antitoxin (DNA-binding transcriptional repressor) of toxin-antitoxin stability system
MNVPINAKQLRGSLPDVVARVRKGTRFTVIYRSRPAFQIVPVDASDHPLEALTQDPLYRAQAVGRSSDGRTAADHDAFLYGDERSGAGHRGPTSGARNRGTGASGSRK